MNPLDLIKSQFVKAGVGCHEIRFIRYDESRFGDFVAEVSTDLGLLRVERERGQCFIDLFDDASGRFIRGDEKWPQLLPLFNRGAWELSDLLLVAKRA